MNEPSQNGAILDRASGPREKHLGRALKRIALCADAALPNARCAVRLRDDWRACGGLSAAPKLPPSFLAELNALPDRIRGAARGIQADDSRLITPSLSKYSDSRLALEANRAGLGSAWSEPIFSRDLVVVGSLTFFLAVPREPLPHELQTSKTLAEIARIVLSSTRPDAPEPHALGSGHADGPAITDETEKVLWVTKWDEHQVQYVSRNYEEVWGYSAATLYADSKSWSYSIHEKDRDRVVNLFLRHAARGTYDVEYRMRRPNGELRWMRDRAFPLYDEAWRVERVAGIAEDVTEVYRARESLRATGAAFGELGERLGTVFWLTDWIERRVLYVSPNWDSVWGQPRACLFSGEKKAWADNIHDEDRGRVLDAFARDAESGTYNVDFRVRHPDGSFRWLNERCIPLRDENGIVHRMAGVAEDVTDRKQVEIELETARDEIDELRREQIASLTSELLLAEENERRRLSQDLHDGMNQLITLALLKLAQLRETSTGGTERLAGEIETLIEQTSSAARSLTYQLSPPILHDLGFEPAIEWLCEDIQRSYELNVELEREGNPRSLDERVRVLLFRAVRELLINVAKHAEASRACVRLRTDSEWLHITVADDGIEFDPAVVGTRGTGIFSIRQRLDNLGGQMRIDTATGGGTFITLVAPLSPADDLTI